MLEEILTTTILIKIVSQKSANIPIIIFTFLYNDFLIQILRLKFFTNRINVMHRASKTLTYLFLLIFLSASTFYQPIDQNLIKLSLDTFGYADVIKLSGHISTFEFYIPMSRGLEPILFQTELMISDDVQDAYFEVWNEDIPLFSQEVSNKEISIQIDLTNAIVTQDTLNLTTRLRLDSSLDLCDTLYIGSWGTLSESTITFSGSIETPTKINEFLPAIAESIYISIPQKPSLSEVETAIYLSQQLSSYYRAFGQIAHITIINGSSKLSEFSESTRLFFIERNAQAGIELELDKNQPYIVIQGDDDDLIRQAKAYANQNLRPSLLTQNVYIERLESTHQSSNRIPFYYLSSSPFELSGIGVLETNLYFTQADFGEPGKTVAVHMSGLYTPIPEGVNASIEIRYNNNLLVTDLLDKSGKYNVFFEIPERFFKRNSELSLSIIYPPQEGHCDYGNQNFFTFDIDEQSYLQVKQGQSIPISIQRYPQVLLPHFHIAIDEFSIEKIQSASTFLNTLQGTTRTELRFTLIAWEETIETQLPLMVVASPDTALKRFNAPFQIDPVNIVNSSSIPFSAEMNISEAGLIETTEFYGKDVLILSYIHEPQKMLDMVTALYNQSSEWHNLTNDVIIYSSNEFLQLDSSFSKPQRFSFISQSFSSLWYQYRIIILSVAFILVLAFVFALLRGSIVRKSASKELKKQQNHKL